MKWEMRPVAELCEFAIDCVNKTAPVVEYETPYKMIRTTNVKGGYIFLDTVRYVTQDVFEKWTRRSKPQYGDVILSREAPVGEVGRFTSNDEFVFLGQRLFHYRANPKLLDWNFLAYVLQSHDVQGRLRGMGFGATVQHITVPDATNLEIPCPPLDVQRRIGGILSAYDDLIENNQRRMKLLEESARLLYEEWFVRLRFPGHEHTKIVDGVPEGWERKLLEEIAEFRLGKMLDQKKNRGDLMPYLANINVRWGKFDLNDLREMRFEDDEIETCGLKFGDIVMCEGGEPGRCAIWKDQMPRMMIQKALHRIRCRDNIDPEYLYYSLRHAGQSGYLATLFTGATIKHLPREKLEKVTVVVPTRSLMDSFINVIRPIENQLGLLDAANKRASNARDLLLPRLMNGEIEV